MDNQEVIVYLTTPEAIMFKDFQCFHSTFFTLVKAGVFDTKGGSVIIHFDKDSNIRKIERHNTIFDDQRKSVL